MRWTEWRQRCGWTRETLSHHLGVDSTMILKIEKGSRRPSLGLFFRLCGALQLSAEETLEALALAVGEAPLECWKLRPSPLASL